MQIISYEKMKKKKKKKNYIKLLHLFYGNTVMETFLKGVFVDGNTISICTVYEYIVRCHVVIYRNPNLCDQEVLFFLKIPSHCSWSDQQSFV